MPTQPKKELRHVIDIRDLDKKFIEDVFSRAETLIHTGRDESLKGKFLCWVGQQPSTRTSISFWAATAHLGGQAFAFPPPEHSSEAKNESWRDTVRVLGASFDAIVIRSREAGFPKEVATFSPVPIINAGNGADEHPTQALADLFTVKRWYKRLEGLTFVIAGDLEMGRAARTLVLALATHFPNNKIIGVPAQAHTVWGMKDDVKDYAASRGVSYKEVPRLKDVIGQADVVYMTRYQKEHPRTGIAGLVYPKLTVEIALKAGGKTIFLHPLPRDADNELSYEIDKFPNALYFREQVPAGLAVRKAILQELLLFR